MAYRKKENFDPNHLPGATDMRKQRTLILAMTPVWLLITMTNMAREDSSAIAKVALEIMWAMFVLTVLLTLTGAMTRWFTPKAYKEQAAVLEDELARHHRAISLQWGMVGTILMALLVYFIAPYGNLDARETVQILILTALTVTSLRFALLERDDGDDGE